MRPRVRTPAPPESSPNPASPCGDQGHPPSRLASERSGKEQMTQGARNSLAAEQRRRPLEGPTGV